MAQGVVGEVEDVVTFVIREMVLQQVKPLVDGLSEAEFADQELDGADATTGDGLCLGGGLVADVGRGDDWFGRWSGDRPVETATDFSLAGSVMAVWNRLHSKSPCGLGHRI